MRILSSQFSVVSNMFVYTALFIGLTNLLGVLCQTQSLDCPTDGSEITISDIGMTSQKYRFPQLGSNAFPQNFECNWKFRAQTGLVIILQVTEISTGNNDDIEVLNTDGVTNFETIKGPQTNSMGSLLVSSGDMMTVRLTTDTVTAAKEEFFINVIAGTTSDIDECAVTPPPCHGNASCVNTEGSFQCSCRPGFTGNGFECQEEPVQQPTLRYFLPILASSLGTGLTGIGLLLALVFAANSSLLPTVWAQ